MDAVEIPRAYETVVENREEAVLEAKNVGYPLVMKVVGPIHKSDVGGVVLNVPDEREMLAEFERMMQIKDTTGILLQPMLSGTELFVGAKYDAQFGHLILCGLGGIYIEVLKDIQTALAPVGKSEALQMINALKTVKILDGVRGQKGIDKEAFAQIVVRLSKLLLAAPEIQELDLNPLLAKGDQIIAVDARIRIKK